MTTDGGDERQGSSFGLAATCYAPEEIDRRRVVVIGLEEHSQPTRDRIVHHHRS